MDAKGHVWYTEAEYNQLYGAVVAWPDASGFAYVEFGADPDDGFNSSGPCGGPICRRCSYHYCTHCHPEGPPEACEGEDTSDQTTNQPGGLINTLSLPA